MTVSKKRMLYLFMLYFLQKVYCERERNQLHHKATCFCCTSNIPELPYNCIGNFCDDFEIVLWHIAERFYPEDFLQSDLATATLQLIYSQYLNFVCNIFAKLQN